MDFIYIGGYNSLLTPTRRRFSYAGSYRKSNSVESSRVFSAYPIDESFDYYMESDGEEADDEFDQITSSNDVDVQVQRPQFSIPKSPQRVSHTFFYNLITNFYLLNISTCTVH